MQIAKKIILNFDIFSVVWVIFIFIVAIVLTLFVPPLQKPDEYVHFYKTIQVSRGVLWCGANGGEYYLPDRYANIFTTVNNYGLTQQPASRFYYGEYFSQPIFDSDFSGEMISTKDACLLPTISYIIPAIGLKLAELTHLNGIISFYIGRVFALLAFFAALVWTVYYSKPGVRYALLAFASLPMTLHQVGSYNYDAPQFVATLLVVFYLFGLLEQKKVAIRQIVPLCLSIILLNLCKLQNFWLFLLLPLLLLQPLLKTEKLKNILKLIAIYTLAAISVILLPRLVFQSSVSDSIYTSQMLQTQLFLQEPVGNFFQVLYKTTSTQFGFFLNSFIGKFGWLDYELPLSMVVISLLLLGYALTKFKIKPAYPMGIFHILLLCLILLGTYLVDIFGMYFVRDPGFYESLPDLGTFISEGTQGRYLLPLLPILFLVIGLIKNHNTWRLVGTVLLFFFATLKIGEAIFMRYYNYETLYDVIPVLQNEDAGTLVPEPSDTEMNELVSEQLFQVSVEPNKKLKGVLAGSARIETKFLYPYIFELYRGTCKSGDSLRSGLITTKMMQDNRLLVIFDRSVRTNNGGEFCLAIQPFMPEAVHQVKRSTIFLGQDIPVPVYLR